MRTRLTISVPEDLQAEIKAQAAREGISMSAWMERFLFELSATYSFEKDRETKRVSLTAKA